MSRPWGGQNHCGESRAAAEPVADRIVLAVEPGPALVARLREALRDAPDARHVVVHSGHPSADQHSLLSEEGLGDAAGVVTSPMSDTVKEVVDGRVRRTVPRATVVQVTGPWVFEREVLAGALTRVAGREAPIADMVGFCEAARLRVRVLPAR